MVHGGPAEEQGPAQPKSQASLCSLGLETAWLPVRDEQEWAAPQGKKSQQLRVRAGQARVLFLCSRTLEQDKQSRSGDAAYAYFIVLRVHECNGISFLPYHKL